MSISEERTESLGARFEQEEMLLEKARQRPLFGWGPSSRAHVFDEATGEDITVVDGEWIIVFGSRGVLGFIAWYGLYLAPIYVARRNQRRVGLPQYRAVLAGFSLIAAMLAAETLPNASATIPQFMWSGVLYGIALNVLRQDRLARLKAVWSRRRRAPTPSTPAIALPRG
jgi:O-antigen ligase